MRKLLEGIKVLDLTRVLSGPYATMILADLGAEIIKIEVPEKGDEARSFGPFKEKESAYFANVNRGKKSITIDLRKEKGQELIRKLAGKCQVLIENFRPGTMKRFKLDFSSLNELYPHLIYVSISGFGQTGPYAHLPAYDVIIQALSGLASITGKEEPVKVGPSISDLNAALFSVIGILAALREAEKSGKGQHLDISMLDCQIALLENAISRYQLLGVIPQPLGSRHPSVTPFQFFKAKNGYLVVAVGNNKQWEKLSSILGLLPNEKFSTNDLRTKNHALLEKILSEKFQQKNVQEWCTQLQRESIPCGPLQNIKEMLEDAQVNSREMIKELAGLKTPNSPFKFSRTQIQIEKPSPALGEHTQEILTEMGFSAEEIIMLKKNGVI